MSKPTVLLIDDEKPYAEIIKAALESLDVEVHIACDSMEALNFLQQITPDLILLDVMMPDVDGLTLLRWLREHSEQDDIPIHVVSARARTEDREAALSAGADGFLAKPFTIRDLQEMVSEYLPLSISRAS
ncbi:MAG: response regulator [Chloroflexi bacterium]|nr:response regulator [Chloroflexota bacterium]